MLRLARRPAALQRVRQHGGAYGTTEMMLALAPIDASPAQRALLASDGLNIKSTADEKTAPFVSQFDDLTVPAENAGRNPSVEHAHREPAGEMVVARPRMPHRLVLGAGPRSHEARAGCDRNQRFDEVRNVRVGDAKMTVPSLPRAHKQAGGFELAQMPRRRRWGDAWAPPPRARPTSSRLPSA